jgi:hypothetical protein
MATISRHLSIVNLCLGCALLQSPDHYKFVLCVQDVYGYNRHIIINLYSVSWMGMATISRSLPVFTLCTISRPLPIIIMCTISRQLSILILSLGCAWLQSLDQYQSLFCV